MDLKPHKQRYFTFMVVPHDVKGKTFSLKVPVFWVYTVIGLAVFSLLLVGSSLVYSSHLSRRLIHYGITMAKNREQKSMIDSFARETDKVNQAITELVREDNELRKLLGLKSWKSKIKLSSKVGDAEDKTGQIAHELKEADLKLSERRGSLEELKSWVNTVRERFATTPSRWPLYGKIVSRFGYRIYPWRGFHTGVDISGSYGTAVQAAANGVVSFVGWRRGYGKTLVIDHGHGISTLYGHLSRAVVKEGQRVRKGQVICYVGNTGYTTGPHLHYEVLKSDQPVNPIAYLNLNILSASRIWRN